MLAAVLLILQATAAAASSMNTMGGVESTGIATIPLSSEQPAGSVLASPPFLEKMIVTKTNTRYLRSRKDAPTTESIVDDVAAPDSEGLEKEHHRLLRPTHGLLDSSTEVYGIVGNAPTGMSSVLSIDGKTVYSAEYKKFSAMDVVTGKKVYTDFGSSWNYVILAHTTDPDILFIGDALGLHKHRLSTGETKLVYAAENVFVFITICMTKDGSTIFWPNVREVQKMDVATEVVTVLHSYESNNLGVMTALQLSQDDSVMYMTAEMYGPCKIYRIRTSDGEVLGEVVDMKLPILGMSVDYKRNLLYVGGFDNFIYQVDINAGLMSVLMGGGTEDHGPGNTILLSDKKKFSVFVPNMDRLFVNEMPGYKKKLFIVQLGEMNAPTTFPTTLPTTDPTREPTTAPSMVPTFLPSTAPSMVPSFHPSSAPTMLPTAAPSMAPSAWPTFDNGKLMGAPDAVSSSYGKDYSSIVQFGQPIVQYKRNGAVSAIIGTALPEYFIGNNQFLIKDGSGPCKKAGGKYRDGVLTVQCGSAPASATVSEESTCTYKVLWSSPDFC